MKKSFLLWIGVVLMIVISMSSCSSDDNFVTNPNDDKATERTYYYYDDYTGKKTPLTLNENNYCINIPKEYDKINERFRANVRILATINSNAFDSHIITRADYKKLISQNFWKEDSKSVIVTSSFFTEENKVVFSIPYVSLTLKKKEDEALLTPYLEKYGLKIDWHSSWTPLAYILSLTLDSKKGPFECANEIYESGDFKSSQPDLAYVPFINTSGDIEEHEVSPEEIPEGALNQTTTEFTEPVWENYVFKNIQFNDTPVEERPKTVTEFYDTYIGKGLADCFKCTQHAEYDNTIHEYYQQYYKDVIVKIRESSFYFLDGAMTWAVCYYLPIKDFDVTPKFDKWVAYEIFKSFMKLDSYYEDRCELQIVSLPEGDSVGPRLVYEVKKGYMGLVIDARTGRALYKTSYDW